MKPTRSKGLPLATAPEFDSQFSSTVWELERAFKQGPKSDALRRALVEAHVEQLRYMEERDEVPRHDRSFHFLRARRGDGILLLPAEESGCDSLRPIGRAFQEKGFSVLASSLAFRKLDAPGRSPLYWQTCADEAEGRYDILSRYATRISVLGAGLGAVMALHLATTRRVRAVLALYPMLYATVGWRRRLSLTLRRLLSRDSRVPSGWSVQRRLAATQARETANKIGVPLYVLAEDQKGRSDEGLSAREARKLMSRAATQVRLLSPNERAPLRELPQDVLRELLAFANKR